jgi:hypothetical protein
LNAGERGKYADDKRADWRKFQAAQRVVASKRGRSANREEEQKCQEEIK